MTFLRSVFKLMVFAEYPFFLRMNAPTGSGCAIVVIRKLAEPGKSSLIPPRRAGRMVSIESTRGRVEALVGLLIGLTHSKTIFAIVTGASDAAAAASALCEMRFDVPGELRMVLPALPDTIVLTHRQVQAILNSRLNRFTHRERKEFFDEFRSLGDEHSGAPE